VNSTNSQWRRTRVLLVACGGLAAMAGLLLTSGCPKNPVDDTVAAPVELTVFHAGSLSVPFREVSTLFEQRHPGVTVKAEAAGSRDCARKISDLGRSCDVFGSADYKVVENLLMPEHTDFNIRFATNEMAIVYTQKSNRANEISSANWCNMLLDDDVIFGRSDPNSDPCGYRTVMVFQLAEQYLRSTATNTSAPKRLTCWPCWKPVRLTMYSSIVQSASNTG